jgi:hypothetical protein
MRNQSITVRHETLSVPRGDVMGPETAMMTAGGLAARNGKEVERLRRQIEVMLAYALDKGLTPAPQAWMFDAVREQPQIDLGGDGWSTPLQEPDQRTGTDALVRAHRELSRLVSPARPASIELLHDYRERKRPARAARIPRQQRKSGGAAGTPGAPGGTPGATALVAQRTPRRLRLPGFGSTVPLVRWLMLATVGFLVLFVLFAASPDAREAITGQNATGVSGPADQPGRPDRRMISTLAVTAGMAPSEQVVQELAAAPAEQAEPAVAPLVAAAVGGESFTDLLLRELFLLSAAGLGACLTALYRVSREVSRATYDPELDHTFVQRVVLGMAAGLVLAELIPLGPDSSALALPAIALVGGFGASVVQRVLSRIVSALEALFSGDADEQEDARRELAQKRTDELLTQAERANLATLLEIRRIAASGAPTRAVIDEIDRMIVQVSPA